MDAYSRGRYRVYEQIWQNYFGGWWHDDSGFPRPLIAWWGNATAWEDRGEAQQVADRLNRGYGGEWIVTERRWRQEV